MIVSYRTLELDNGRIEVLRGDGMEPRTYEVIARFYDKEMAAQYANQMAVDQIQLDEDEELCRMLAKGVNGHCHEDLTEKQATILAALKSKSVKGISTMDAREIAAETGIPRSSVYPVLKALRTKAEISFDEFGTYRLLQSN